jgi:3'-phosphoadenosine 5'-phosphosulfate sulfotransferase (PAPS reductase)/FAD synthetase
MRNPYLLNGPAIIAFSGGRTSGLMLYRIIEAHGGRLPDDVVPVFCNTGKEHEATLDFVRECADEWGARIRWIEYVDAAVPNQRVREVDYSNASRAGEPFAAVIDRKGMLPNPVKRVCTTEMKIHATHRFARRDLGFDADYDKAIGLRADEARRVANARVREQSGKDPWALSFPLYEAGVTVADVVEFWRGHSFDLRLPLLPDGTTPLGNCDLCFLKAAGKISSIIALYPERAEWWIEQERRVGYTFRKDRPAYQKIKDQGVMFTEEDEDAIACDCTD